MVDLEGAHLDPLDRLDHEVRQIILRDPVPKIGRKQKRLVPLAVDKFAHGEILTENLPKVRHTASPAFGREFSIFPTKFAYQSNQSKACREVAFRLQVNRLDFKSVKVASSR